MTLSANHRLQKYFIDNKIINNYLIKNNIKTFLKFNNYNFKTFALLFINFIFN